MDQTDGRVVVGISVVVEHLPSDSDGHKWESAKDVYLWLKYIADAQEES